MCGVGRDRQLFVRICYVLLNDAGLQEDRFRRFFLPSLLQLSLDTVSNVRLAVAKVLLTTSNPGVFPVVRRLPRLTLAFIFSRYGFCDHNEWMTCLHITTGDAVLL